MASTVSWLDFAESDRRKALEVIDLFREKSTLDELGLAPIRDSFAECLFPGTSTIQTRARYFLFVPWLLKRCERRKGTAAEIAEWLRYEEARLMDALLRDGEPQGVIGREAKDKLKRMPSSVYWRGLKLWQIRLFDGYIEKYCQWVSRGGSREERDVVLTDDGEPVSGVSRQWHPSLPPAPKDLLSKADMELTRTEAEFLKDRIGQSAPESALAFLALNATGESDVRYVWEHELAAHFPAPLRRTVEHARCFALCMWGSAIAYALHVTLQKGAEGEVLPQLRESAQRWIDAVEGDRARLVAWDRSDFWTLTSALNPRLPASTQAFAEWWIQLALKRDLTVALLESPEVERPLRAREQTSKGPRARLVPENKRARDLWTGDADFSSMDYRWGSAQVILNDIVRSLYAGAAGSHA